MFFVRNLEYRKSKVSSVKSCTNTINKFKKAWEDHQWTRINKEVPMPSWISVDLMEDNSYPILKDPCIIEMLNVFADRFPAVPARRVAW